MEAVWLGRKFAEISGFSEPKAITVYIDNQWAISYAKNASVNAGNKHIDVRSHCVKHMVSNSRVKLEYVQTDKQVADLLTKPLPPSVFGVHIPSMGLALQEREPDRTEQGGVLCSKLHLRESCSVSASVTNTEDEPQKRM